MSYIGMNVPQEKVSIHVLLFKKYGLFYCQYSLNTSILKKEILELYNI